MSDIPIRPPAPAPPLPAGWTEHMAPTGHTYFYHKETRKSTYARPTIATSPASQIHNSLSQKPPSYDASSVQHTQPPQHSFDPQRSLQELIFASAPTQFVKPAEPRQGRGGHQGGIRGGRDTCIDRRRTQDDRPKHRQAPKRFPSEKRRPRKRADAKNTLEIRKNQNVYFQRKTR